MIIQQADEGRVAVALWRAGQMLPEPAGEPFPFTSPLDAAAHEDLRWYLEDYLMAPFAVYEDRGQTIGAKLDDWGEALFNALFGAGKPRDDYMKAREGAGLAEIVIASGSAGFLELPWELLKDPSRGRPLALDIAAFDRTLPTAGGSAEMERAPGEALRVLMVIARPAGIQDVGYQMIARPLLERLKPVSGRVDLHVLRPPTFATLKATLRAARDAGQPFQIVHFDGHGVFAQAPAGIPDPRFYKRGGEQGYVIFEKEAGGDDPVTAEDFAGVLRDARVPLVVLNACQSGAMGEVAEAAVATRLLQDGAASVVAMGYSVYAVAAAEFTAAFYEALFAGLSVSAAVGEGRRRLKHRPERPSPKGPMPLSDWVVPVHYMRRALAFPDLKRTRPAAGPSLDALLDAMGAPRRPQGAPEGVPVHGEGSLEAEQGLFFGRDAAFYVLEQAARLQRVVVIHGPGGTGKTELAKAFARWWRDSGGLDDKAFVFFHSFEPGLPSFGLDGVVNALGLRIYGPDFIGRTENAEHRRHVILETLRQHRMLVIWDNFESLHSMPDPTGATPPLDAARRDELRAFVAALARPGGKSALLITSRTTEDWLGDVRRIPFGGLRPQEAAEYADALLAPYPAARQRRQSAAFAELLEALEGHPLSLRLMLPQLEAAAPETVLAALRGEAPLPAGFDASEHRTRSLAASVKYSLDHLPEDIRTLLPVLSLFEGVVVADVLAIFSEHEEVPARFAGHAGDRWEAALAATARVGLTTALGWGMYRLHPALPAYLRALWHAEAGAGFETERVAADRALLHACAELGVCILQQIEGGMAETAFTIFDLQRRTFGRLIAFGLDQGLWDAVQDILEPLDEYWDARGLRDEAQGWTDRIRAALERADGTPPDFDGKAGALWLFAVGAEANRRRDAGDLDAAEDIHDNIRKALETAPQGETRDRRLAVAYHQLGIVAQLNGDWATAEAWYRKSLEIEQALGDWPGMARTYYQLGMVAQVCGDLKPAEDWTRKSLEIEEALGNHLGMAGSYHQFGILAQLRGDLKAAEAWHRKSLEIRKALGNRPGMASSYHHLGIVAQHLGDLPAAEAWYRRSLEIDEALGNRPEMAKTYGQLGLLAEARQDAAGAMDWTVRCVRLFAEFPHPSTGPAPAHLARLSAALGMDALAASWQRGTGQPLPEAVRQGVQRLIDEGGAR